MKRYQTTGTYRIYHTAKDLDTARSQAKNIHKRMTEAAQDGVLRTNIQFDGSTDAVFIPPVDENQGQLFT